MKEKRPLFKDDALQAQFERDGWVKLSLLDGDEVERLLAYYHNLPAEPLPDYGFHVSMDKASQSLKEGVMKELREVIGRKAASYFRDFQIFTASFVVKEHNPKGVVPPHQDWTFVDEEQFDSVTVWTTLVPTDMHNGCMGVINGSHRYFDYIRASPSPQCKTPISDHAFTLFPYMQLVPMVPGEALVFDNRTIHASPPNTSGQARIAAGIGITQAEAELYHYYLLPDEQPEQLERYTVDPQFFAQYNNGMLSAMHKEGKRPQGVTRKGTVVRNLPKFTGDEILGMVKQHPDNKMNVELVERLAQLFGYNVDGSKKAEAEPVAAAPVKKGFFKRIFG